jgi:isopentenyl-diphosphate delta-isomerase
MKNENDEEVFDVLDEAGRVTGQEQRLVVHRTGLLHQAVHVLLEDAGTGQRVLVQKRAAAKRIAPSLWDISCAEHLQPGESMEDGARRGVMEELGVEVKELRLLRETRLFRRTYAFDGETYHDNEFIACYGAAIDSKQPLTIDHSELSETKWLDRSELRRQLREMPDDFTPWFVDEAHLL